MTHALPILDPAHLQPMTAADANRRYVTEALDLALAAAVGRNLAKERRGRRNLFVSLFRSRP